MENKLNIAKLLKDCPKGMELDCPLFDGLEFDYIDNDNLNYPVICRIRCSEGGYNIHAFTKYGCYNLYEYSKCIIFPKGKTNWEGFVPPFKDGDILSYQFEGFKNRTIYIYMYHSRMNTTYYAALSGNTDSEFMINDKKGHALNSYNDTVRLATEEEKQKLFDAIKANGYKWNAETKTLEELPKFKVGDRIKSLISSAYYTIVSIQDNYYLVKSDTEPYPYEVSFENAINYELAPNKFDIKTLKPFTKVLVRKNNYWKWNIDFFGYYNEGNCHITDTRIARQCIPYEGNEHLLGATDDCDEYYKTWE